MFECDIAPSLTDMGCSNEGPRSRGDRSFVTAAMQCVKRLGLEHREKEAKYVPKNLGWKLVDEEQCISACTDLLYVGLREGELVIAGFDLESDVAFDVFESFGDS